MMIVCFFYVCPQPWRHILTQGSRLHQPIWKGIPMFGFSNLLSTGISTANQKSGRQGLGLLVMCCFDFGLTWVGPSNHVSLTVILGLSSGL
jgi:hypothetical protein